MPITIEQITDINSLSSSVIQGVLKIHKDNVDSGCLEPYSLYTNVDSFKNGFLGTKKELYLAFENSRDAVLGFLIFSEPNVISLIEVDPIKQKHGTGTMLINKAQSLYGRLIAKIDSNCPEGINKLLRNNGFKGTGGILTWNNS